MKTALITGGNQGIGFETARQLESKGYFVYIGCRDARKGEDAIRKLNQQGAANAAFLQLDTTDHRSVLRASRRLENELKALDILINNAAIAGESLQQIDTIKTDALKTVFETNFFGVVQTTQAFIPLLSKSELPVILNVSSELGSLQTHLTTDNPNYRAYDAYSASKAALNAFTVLLAGQLKATPFKINSVTPGYTATNLNQYRGAKTPVEAAAVIVQYAVSDSEGPSGGFFSQSGIVPW